MDFKELLLGKPGQIQGVSPYSPEALQDMSKLRRSGLDILANPSAGFEPIAQQARTRFGQQTVPMLAERFLGSGQNLASSGLTQQLGQAGAGLEEALAAMQSQYGLQNRSQALQALSMGLQPQYQFFQTPEQQGLFAQLLPMAIQAGLGYLTGGASGAMMGGLKGMSGGTEFGNRLSNIQNELTSQKYASKPIFNSSGGVQGLYNPIFSSGFTSPAITAGTVFNNPSIF